MWKPSKAATLCAATIVSVMSISAHAATTSILPSLSGLAVDNGPADGVFDSTILAVGPGNNGYSDIRYAAEFSLSSIPVHSRIDHALLMTQVSDFEGVRSVQLNGYAGDGLLTMADFVAGQDIGHDSVVPTGTQDVNFDVTSFLSGLIGHAGYVGFNLRETPANSHNYLLFRVERATLSVAYAPVPLPGPALLIAPALGVLALRRRQSGSTQPACGAA